MKKLAAIILALLFCVSSSFCVLAGDGGDLPDVEEEKEQNGSYLDQGGRNWKNQNRFCRLNRSNSPRNPKNPDSACWALNSKALCSGSALS